MTLFLLLLAVAVIGGVFAVALGRVRGGLDAPTVSRPYRGLPATHLIADDVDAVRFSLALRGYRMDEVDAAMSRLAAALADRDEEIRSLRRRVAAQPTQHQPTQHQPTRHEPTRHEPT